MYHYTVFDTQLWELCTHLLLKTDWFLLSDPQNWRKAYLTDNLIQWRFLKTNVLSYWKS
jgi:hypothetical protein